MCDLCVSERLRASGGSSSSSGVSLCHIGNFCCFKLAFVVLERNESLRHHPKWQSHVLATKGRKEHTGNVFYLQQSSSLKCLRVEIKKI